MHDTQDLSSSSNTGPYPAYTPTVSAPVKPPTPTIAQLTLERLTRIETLLLLLYKRALVVECLSVAVLVALAFLLGHVWR